MGEVESSRNRWLRAVVHGYLSYHAVPGRSMTFPLI